MPDVSEACARFVKVLALAREEGIGVEEELLRVDVGRRDFYVVEVVVVDTLSRIKKSMIQLLKTLIDSLLMLIKLDKHRVSLRGLQKTCHLRVELGPEPPG